MTPLIYALLRGRGGEGELVDSEGRSLRPFTVKQGILIAWASGVVFYLGTCYWIYPVMNGYGGLNVIAASAAQQRIDQRSHAYPTQKKERWLGEDENLQHAGEAGQRPGSGWNIAHRNEF